EAPSSLLSFFSTRAAQEAQVIPPTDSSMRCRSAASESISEVIALSPYTAWGYLSARHYTPQGYLSTLPVHPTRTPRPSVPHAVGPGPPSRTFAVDPAPHSKRTLSCANAPHPTAELRGPSLCER